MKMKECQTPQGSTANGEAGAHCEETVVDIFLGICHSPREYILQRWNWKAALLSSIVRSSIFFATNLSAGQSAALAAMAREFGFRSIASGFYGGLTESFRSARPCWAATLTVLVSLPILNHSAEFLLHWLLGTANLKMSIMASVGFTVLSTGFNLFAMRREVLITRHNCRSLAGDLKMIPGLLLSYSLVILRLPWTAVFCLWNLRYRRHSLSISLSKKASDVLPT